jgi:glutathione synthase
MKSEVSFLWVTDPWSSLDHPYDTTLRLMQEAWIYGCTNFWCDSRSIRLQDGQIICGVRKLTAVNSERGKNGFTFEKKSDVCLNIFDYIHYRVDPPIDVTYLQPLQLLVLGINQLYQNGKTEKLELVNSANCLVMSDKVESLLIDSSLPETLVSCQAKAILNFIHLHDNVIVKPMNCCQSKGVRLVSTYHLSQDQIRSIIRQATINHTRPVVVQKLIEQVSAGEIRLWFSDGRLIGWAKKLPVHHPFIINIDSGDPVVATDLTEEQLKLSEVIGASLMQRKIRLAAVDIIGDHIIDYNFVSPGLLVQIEKVMEKNIARVVIESFVSDTAHYRKLLSVNA